MNIVPIGGLIHVVRDRLRIAVLTGRELAERVSGVERSQVAQEKELGEHAVDIHELFAAMRRLASSARRQSQTHPNRLE